MASYRASHQQKTVNERFEYVRTTIKGISPTIEDNSMTLAAESTDSPSIETDNLQESTITPIRRESWVEKYKSELIKSMISLIIITIFGGICYGIYLLNREVGVIGAKLEELKKDQIGFSSSINNLEQRLNRGIESNTSRIDRLFESRFNRSQEANTKQRSPNSGEK